MGFDIFKKLVYYYNLVQGCYVSADVTEILSLVQPEQIISALAKFMKAVKTASPMWRYVNRDNGKHGTIIQTFC